MQTEMQNQETYTGVENDDIPPVAQEVLSDFVVINNKEYKITPLNAKKTAVIMNIFGKLLISGKLKLREFKGADAKDLPMAILAAVDEPTLIALTSIIVGEDEAFVREHFNLSWVVEALAIQIREAEFAKVVRNFTLLVSQIA